MLSGKTKPGIFAYTRTSSERYSEESVGGKLAGGESVGGELTGGELTGGELAGGELTGGESGGGELAGGESTGGELTAPVSPPPYCECISPSFPFFHFRRERISPPLTVNASPLHFFIFAVSVTPLPLL